MKTWTQFKTLLTNKVLSIQFEEDNSIYIIKVYDPPVIYECIIYKGTVPADGTDGFSITQVQNDLDKTDWETNYKPYANRPIIPNSFGDPRVFHRFGNLTAASVSEVLVSARPYTETASQAQRSIVSTSVTDSDALATGARQVRITYLDSNYILKTEDVLLAGTVAQNTVNLDIRFIESLKVIKGTAAVGAIKLMTTTAGGGTEICGIGAGTEDAFLCHHYIPAGMRAILLGWSATISDDANFKLKGQTRYNSNLVDINIDLDNVGGATGPITAGGRASFKRTFGNGLIFEEKTYLRITVVPVQGTTTVVRAYMDLWEDKY